MNIFKKIILLSTICSVMPIAACSEEDPITNPPVKHEQIEIERGTFAKGADVSWLTQMEKQNIHFYTPDREEMECMKLLRDYCGVNSIRLRVWVNPTEGWNNVSDVAVKAQRANALGLRLMIDFHFSDTWADPGNQIVPAAWSGLDLEGMCAAVSNHVTDMLTRLQVLGIEPEWVQIGNETTPGMMLPMGSVKNPDRWAALNNAGYDAVKALFPNAKCIIHLDAGDNKGRYDRIFDLLEANGAKYDMIGMSVYPYWAETDGAEGGWRGVMNNCIANISHLKEKYGKPVMICEIGMPYDKAEECKELIARMMQTEVDGIFYWEPEAPNGYNGGYNMGCFDNGAPTCALDPFKNTEE